MQSSNQLQDMLHSINRKSYPAYKSLKGAYQFKKYVCLLYTSMNPILEKVNEQMDGKYVIEYTYVANTDYNNVLSTQLASGAVSYTHLGWRQMPDIPHIQEK